MPETPRRATVQAMTEARADGVPAQCTTCGTDIPPGRSRCVACGRVFGEANRCPHCHAMAGVLRRSGGYACAACSKPRELLDGTVVLDGGAGPGGALARVGTSSGARRAGIAGLRAFGVLSLAGGVLAAVAAAILLPSPFGIAVAILLGGGGAAIGGLSLKGAADQSKHLAAGDRRARELAILDLAQKRGGRLSVTDVARELHMSPGEAEKALTEMADGSRVTVELLPDGLLLYHFRELPAGDGAPRVRVSDQATAEPEVEPIEREERARTQWREGNQR